MRWMPPATSARIAIILLGRDLLCQHLTNLGEDLPQPVVAGVVGVVCLKDEPASELGQGRGGGLWRGTGCKQCGEQECESSPPIDAGETLTPDACVLTFVQRASW